MQFPGAIAMVEAAGRTVVAELSAGYPIQSRDALLVAELRTGSEVAFVWLVEHYQQPVYNLLLRIVADPAVAADTVQEVFLKVFRNIRSFRNRSSLKTWIYRIAVHEASNQRRWWARHWTRESSLEEHAPSSPHSLGELLMDTGESPFETAARDELGREIERALAQVDEPFRTAVVLRDIEELSYEEMAEVLNVSMGTVKSRLARGREALKRLLEPYLNHGERAG